MATARIEARKVRDRAARRDQILTTARRIAEAEGWPSVTVRRLSDEIAYSQPVLYSHFENREAIVAAVAVAGFGELGLALEQARRPQKRGSSLERAARAYLRFAAESPALYQAMFTLRLSVPFDEAGTPPELRFAFEQLLELFRGPDVSRDALTEVFWANLHGQAELERTGRLPPRRREERVRTLVRAFSPRDAALTEDQA